MQLLARLDECRQAIDVLEHPFYRRWSQGALSAPELARYAGEYRHAVLALAEASAAAAAKAPRAHRGALRAHAEEEAAHVQLWERFARCAGAPAATAQPREPLAQTRECAAAWTAGEDALEHLAVLYAIEGAQPAISRTKLAGLVRHYGFGEEAPASEYFRVHAVRDVEHAREAGELIERLLDSASEARSQSLAQRMLARARAALRGNWLLLDGVEGACAQAAARA